MRETANITSQYTSNQITNLKQASIYARKRSIFKIVDAIIVSCFRSASPFLPLVACAMVNYSLQNGVVEESATAFAVFGYFKIFLEKNFKEGKWWGEMALGVLDSKSVFASCKCGHVYQRSNAHVLRTTRDPLKLLFVKSNSDSLWLRSILVHSTQRYFIHTS